MIKRNYVTGRGATGTCVVQGLKRRKRSVKTARKTYKRFHRLDTVAAACGFNMRNHHHALADAEACAWIAREIL